MPDIKCNIIIDSCCDLPASVVNLPGVEVLRFPYFLDNEEHLDDFFTSVSVHDFYESMRKGANPTTSQLPVSVLTNAFIRAAQSKVPTVYLSFTSGLSGSFDAAELVCKSAREQYPEAELYVVDTKLASVAEGLLVFEAIRQRALGLSAVELVKWAEEARFFVNELFMIDDLDALKRGGRIPSSVAFAGAKLDVKPLLDISHAGKLSLAGVARGRKKGIKQLAEFYKKNAVDIGSGSRVVIGSADCPKDVERLKAELSKIDESLLFLETSIGPVIGSHVGPGMLAIVFMGADCREELSVSDRIAQKVRSDKDA